MSFETEKRKLRGVYEGGQKNRNQIDSAALIQGKKTVQIALSAPSVVTFGKFRTQNSEWVPLVPQAPDNQGVYSYRAVNFYVEMILPESYIPFARLNVAYRYADQSVEVFYANDVEYNVFMQIMNGPTATLKKVRWNVGMAMFASYWYDFEVKLFFTMLNPLYLTAS